jgi:hypothetical protein
MGKEQERAVEAHEDRVRDIMKRNTPVRLVGEGGHDLGGASRIEMEAINRARSQAGVVQHLSDWERTATPAQREARRRESLRNEAKTDVKMESQLGGEVRAKYKIEVEFLGPDEKGYPGRTSKGPNRLGVKVWESGKKFHGGGDELMFWCLSSIKGVTGGCGGIMSADNIRNGVAMCPHCKNMMNLEAMTDTRAGFFTNQSLVKELVQLFRSLGSDCDIYVKFHKTDIHYIAMERDKGPEVAARLKGMHIYPLKNILKDTAMGADLGKRFLAFFNS